MAEYDRRTQRFTQPGLSTRPRGAQKPGRQTFLQNLRQVTPETLETRAGCRVLSSAPFGAVIHSMARLNDPSQSNAVRIVGAGTNLYAAHPTDPQTYGSAVDTGYGGTDKPLTIVTATPKQSARPYAYLTDGTRQKKLNTDPTVYSIGLPAPVGPPAILVSRPGANVIDLIDTVSHWSSAGGSTSAVASDTRVNTVIGAIFYDYLAASFTPATTGYCAIIPGTAAGITEGMLVVIDSETTIVERILVQVATTTIATIVYDSGTTGPCSIYPTNSLGTGQVETPPLDAYKRRYPGSYPYLTPPGERTLPVFVGANIIELSQEGLTRPLSAPATRHIRQVDFPVGSLVTLGGAETVPILSVNVDADGFQSFRCVTTGTRSAGDAILGLGPGFRCHLNHTAAPGSTITAGALKNTITPTLLAPDTGVSVTGGIQRGATMNLATISGRPTLGEDLVRFQIKVDDLTVVDAVRLYLDCNPITQDFLQNYFVFEWRANDLIAAIQATNAGQTETFSTVTIESIIKHDYDRGVAVDTDAYLAKVRALVQDPTFQQLALGNNQWIALEVPVSRLTRVGTMVGQTLADVKAAELLVVATPKDPIHIAYQGLYLTGGYGPDVGKVGDPYVYRYRYRSSITGEVSNPSPLSRSHAIVRRQSVSLYATASSQAQADLIDWFRLGGSLTRWTFVGTAPNTTTPFLDILGDIVVDGGETLPFDDFQPWVTLDTRKAGTCKVAGAALQYLSGDHFDARWAVGTIILVNGKAATLDQVISTTVVLLAENAGTGSPVDFVVPSPQLVGQPLPTFFSDDAGHLFAVGDTHNAGTLYWAKFNDPDSHSDANSLVVSPGTEPLINGAQWDNGLFLFSTRRQYEITIGNDGTVAARPTACEKGASSPQGIVSTPYGIFFVSDDGLYLTKGGSEAVSITSEDLAEIFPRDQVPGRDVGLIPTPEMGGRGRDLRLTWVDGLLYFDYEGATTEDTYRSLVFDPREGTWSFDRYPGDHEIVRLDEEAEGEGTDTGGRIRRHLVALDKQVTVMEGGQDLGSAISWIWYSALVDYGDTRSVKQWGDTILDLDPKGATVSVTPVFDEATTVDPAQTLTAIGRQTWILPIRDGDGALARNMGLRASGSTSTGLRLYLWEPAGLIKVEAATSRATDWDDLGVNGAKFVQGIVIRAQTYGQDKTILVQGDRTTQLTLTVNHNGEKEIAYPIASGGWTPFVAHLVRLWPSGDPDNWLLLSARWVWEPAPELASEWTTQPTTHDFPGYLHVRDGFFAYSDAANPITFEIFYDGVSVATTITPASTAYARVYVIFPARKGRSVSYRWKSNTPFRLYRKDTSVRVHAWGNPQGYVIASPFGGESRLIGAQI